MDPIRPVLPNEKPHRGMRKWGGELSVTLASAALFVGAYLLLSHADPNAGFGTVADFMRPLWALLKVTVFSGISWLLSWIYVTREGIADGDGWHQHIIWAIYLLSLVLSSL